MKQPVLKMRYHKAGIHITLCYCRFYVMATELLIVLQGNISAAYRLSADTNRGC
jgi:hypothetical protein